jgi:LL-diaminopimelate aminotransferase
MELPPATRLAKLPPYLFADLRRKMAQARAKGVEVLRIDIGDPDQPTPEPIVERLVAAATDPDDPDRHRYGCDRPVEQLGESIRGFYKRRWGVELGDGEFVATMGSKDAIVKLCMGIMDPGDIGIAPVPGYPTYNIGHVFCSGVTHPLALRGSNGWLPDFEEIPHEVCRQAKVLWLNYPNNPTTATADRAFFQRAVEFGRQHGILIAHDAAYSVNTYGDYVAPSILEVDGARDVAVEFFSLSKAFNMTGWRFGFVAGNASAIRALNTVKENIDNGSPRAIQAAAVEALDRAEQVIAPLNEIYRRRRDLVVDALNEAGWSLDKPSATIYVWAPVPDEYAGDSGRFVGDLLDKTGVMVTPGRGYGQWSEGYFRISLTYPDDVLREAMDRIIKM